MIEDGKIWINGKYAGKRMEVHLMLREMAHYVVGSDVDGAVTVTWLTEALITLGGLGKL